MASNSSLPAALLSALLLSGCATPSQRLERRAWRTLCQHAPYEAGDSLGRDEQRALAVVNGYRLGIEAINQRCAHGH